MERRRLLAQEHASSIIAYEPSTNNPPRQVVDEQTMEDLIDAGCSANEIYDGVDGKSLDEEVPMVHSHEQFLYVVETPQQRGQQFQNIGPLSMPPLETMHRRTLKFIQLDESGLASLGGKLPN